MPFIRLDLKGKRFGKLVVIEPYEYRTGGWMWKCKCDCGKETTAYGSKLTHGKKKSCGCGRDKSNNYAWGGYGEMMGTVWHRVFSHAKNRNLKVEITNKDVWELFLRQDRKCALSGVPLYFAKTNKELKNKKQTASLDRIDSSKDYTKNNVQWIHKDLNSMKWDWDQDEFINWCNLVSECQNEKKNTETD